MGVRFYDKENMSNGYNFATTTRTNCNCNTHNLLASSAATTTSSTNATQTTNNVKNGNNIHFQKSSNLREIVGNCKQVRIEDNIHNLRIVGNNNCIRITLNMGDITIIGNNTRLKIKTNHGIIKYTGNNGRISLGKESTEQLVDYSGCNGVLKVQNSKKSSQVNKHDNGADDMINNSAMGSTRSNEKFSESKNQKYAPPSVSEVFKCHNQYDHEKAMPNVTTTCSNCAQPLSRSVVPSFGDIVITNSSNICISPYTYSY